MKCRLILLSAVLCLATAFPVSAEYYQYRDKEGNLHFTDNKGQIPAYARDQVKSYNSAKPEKSRPEAAGQNSARKQKASAPDPNTWDGQLRIKAQELRGERQELQQKYERLQKEKARLQELHPEEMEPEERSAYRDRKRKLQERIARYHQNQLEFQEKINQFKQNFQKRPRPSSAGTDRGGKT